MSFARSISNKYGMKLVDTAKKSAIQKTADATGDLVGNKITGKLTSVSKKSTKKLSTIDEDAEVTTPKKRLKISKLNILYNNNIIKWNTIKWQIC